MYSKILQLCNTITPLNHEQEELVKNSFKPLNLKKNDFFLKQGEVNKYIGFINKGLVRYFIYKNDEEATFEFTKEGDFIADYQSFSQMKVSIQNIQAIEDCELLVLDFSATQRLFNTTSFGNLIGRIIMEHRFDVMVTQLLSIYMHNQEERYTHFISNYSALSQRIPQYLIASYVGIKPQSLSRIRRRFVSK
jgi:CRP-like cAMP-binding protein